MVREINGSGVFASDPVVHGSFVLRPSDLPEPPAEGDYLLSDDNHVGEDDD